MHLSAYLKLTPGSGTRLATKLGISPSYLWQMASGHRPTPVTTAVDIERVTSQQVRRWDLRPDDWHRIWPELVGAPGAPDVPEQEAA